MLEDRSSPLESCITMRNRSIRSQVSSGYVGKGYETNTDSRVGSHRTGKSGDFEYGHEEEEEKKKKQGPEENSEEEEYESEDEDVKEFLAVLRGPNHHLETQSSDHDV